MTNPLIDILGDEFAATLRNAPMPTYDGYEPDELSLARIQRYMAEGRFDELSDDAQKWVCGRLMPSLARFGCYPPPNA